MSYLFIKKWTSRFIIILNFCFLLTLLLDLIIENDRESQSVYIIVLNFLYIFSYRNSIILNIRHNKLSPFKMSIYIVFILIFIQIIISSVHFEYITSLRLSIALLTIYSQLIIILKTHKDNSALYVNFSSIIVCISILVFILLHLGLINIENFIVQSGRFSLLDNNSAVSKATNYLVLGVSFIVGNPRGIPFWGDFGLFTGICHEPHISTLFISPALFFLIGSRNKAIKNYLLPAFFIIYFLIASSVTNFVIIPICSILALVLVKNSRKSKVLIISVFVLVLLYILLNLSSFIESMNISFVLEKINDSTVYSSRGVSTSILEYMYSPKTILGSGIFVLSGAPNSQDIGYINFLLIICFQILFLYGCYRFIFSNNNKKVLFGIGLLYFLLHSLKIGQMIFQFPFLIFILYIAHTEYIDINETLKKNH